MGISMVLNMYSVAVVAVLSAPLYMLIMAKVHKKGAVLLTFAIVGILWGLFGGIFVLIWMLGIGVVGEVLASKSKYQNYKMLTVSFGLYSVGYYLGAIAPLYYYPAFWYGFDRPKETVDAMIAAAHSTAGLAAIPVTLIAIVIGAVIAKRMLKKHFEKAGVPQSRSSRTAVQQALRNLDFTTKSNGKRQKREVSGVFLHNCDLNDFGRFGKIWLNQTHVNPFYRG